MAANEVEKLERRMGSKIEEVRDMMLDRFCGVDQKLTAIEELLRKMMDAQNQDGNARVKATFKGAVESSKSQSEENKMLIGGDDGAPSREYGAPSHEYGASNPYGWIGLYNPYGKDNSAGPDFGMGRDFCAPAWVGQQQSNFWQRNRPHEGTRTQSGRGTNGFKQEAVKIEETGWSRKKSEHNGENIVKTGQDKVFKDSSKGTKKSCVDSSGSWDKLADKTNVSLQSSAKLGPCGKKDSRSWAKEVDNERNGNCGSVEKVEGSNWDEKVNGKSNSNDGWGKKADHQSQAHNGENIVKMGQVEEVFKDSSKGTRKSRVASSGSWDKLADKTNVSLQSSAKPDPCGKKDSRSWAKEVDNDRNGNCGSVEKVEGSNWDEKVNRKSNSNNGWGKKADHQSQAHNGENIVKTGQVEVFKDSSKGTKKSCVASSGSWDKLTDKTNVSLQGSAKPDPWDKKDSRSLAKEVDNEKNGNCGSVEKVEGSNWDEKVNGKTNSNDVWGKIADHQSQAQGSWGWKRKRPNSPTGDPNDVSRYSGPLTATKQPLDIFTSDEQEMLTEIEPIMISIKRILNLEGYNDGDPLSADDQTCIIDHVFNYHPNKDQKMGAGIDYVMVAKHRNFPDSRCLYVVTTDGRKEDFSYIKCLQNFARRKYPDKGDEFISKYLKKPRPRHRPPRDMDDGSVVGGMGRPIFQSGWNREPVVAAYGAGTSWHHTRVGQVGPEKKQDLYRQQMAAPRLGS